MMLANVVQLQRKRSVCDRRVEPSQLVQLFELELAKYGSRDLKGYARPQPLFWCHTIKTCPRMKWSHIRAVKHLG